MTETRKPAVAGMFYPDDKQELHQLVKSYLNQAQKRSEIPKAIIVPHAGYIYSGPIAASAYALIQQAHKTINRVVLLGPAHRVAINGMAASSADNFETPLGSVAVDRDTIDQLLTLACVEINDEAHRQEHSIEVHLPFLQETLDEFILIPLVVGEATSEDVCLVLEKCWGGDETLIVISSDLSHYHDYDTAQQLDSATSKAIEALQPESIGYNNACGRNPVNGLLTIVKKLSMQVHTIDLRNSGDTAGSRDQVVGYGAYIVH